MLADQYYTHGQDWFWLCVMVALIVFLIIDGRRKFNKKDK